MEGQTRPYSAFRRLSCGTPGGTQIDVSAPDRRSALSRYLPVIELVAPRLGVIGTLGRRASLAERRPAPRALGAGWTHRTSRWNIRSAEDPMAIGDAALGS